MLVLDKRLQSALDSRKERGILRVLPQSSSSPTNSTSSGNSKQIGEAHGETDFYTSDYLSLATLPAHRTRFLERIQRDHQASSCSSEAGPGSGSGGSRLLVNTQHHASLERRLTRFFRGTQGLLFNSGFDANVGFFSSVPGPEDYILYDEYIHASVHDGMRASRVLPPRRRAFRHNDVEDLRRNLEVITDESRGCAERNVFIAVEALYSMDGDFAPLDAIVSLVDALIPPGLNKGLEVHIIVDEAHSTGICGAKGRGLVCALGLEHRITARLHTFGKAMAASGAILLTTPLIRSYLINYARTLIYTTALGHPALTSIETSLDLLENGTASLLAAKLSSLVRLFVTILKSRLKAALVPTRLVALPESFDCYATIQSDLVAPFDFSDNRVVSPIPTPPMIPLLTPHARPLAAFLCKQGLIVRPITWPTVPKGADRVRVCLHAGNTEDDVQRLVDGVIEWSRVILKRENAEKEVGWARSISVGRESSEHILAAKL